MAADLDDPQPDAAANDNGSFSIAILGDFSARAHRGAIDTAAAAKTPLAKRRALRIDRDDLDAVLARVAPRLEIAIDPLQPPIVITFKTLDDFHPDRLVERVPILQQLRQMREQLSSTGQQPQRVPRPQSRPDDRRADAAALLSGGSLLDRIVDNDPASSNPEQQRRGVSPQDELADFIDRAVQPHTIAEASAEQKGMLAKVDDAIAATMRVVLHHPDFQALEALWRGVDFLVRRLDTDESLHVFLVDVTKDELIAGLDASAAIARWSLVAAAYSFGPDEVAMLGRLASLGASMGAPIIAAANPELAGTMSFAGDPDPDEWTIPSPRAWDALRSADDASFLGLAAPRFLARVPYGKRSDECTFAPFEEIPPANEAHESYLWSNPALLCALAIGESVSSGDAPATHATVDGLPLYVATIDGEPTVKPCAEALLSQRAVTHMLDRGLTPLATERDGDAIRLPRVQSVAMPPRPLSVRNR
jgi:type VI secretion system ImpB/VipA family protein